MRPTTSNSGGWLSWGRIVAVLRKEFVQLRRDRLTFAMMLGVPIMQVVLFGDAINGDPRGLPTAIVAASLASRAISSKVSRSDVRRKR